MKKTILSIFVCWLACQPRVVRPSIVDSDTGCPEACGHMKEQFSECPEGHDPQCVPGCERTARLGYVWMDDSSGPLCIVQATTMQQLHDCNVQCQID